MFIYRFHEETFEKYERERRKKLLDWRRHGGHMLQPFLTSSSTAATSSSGAGPQTSSGSKAHKRSHELASSRSPGKYRTGGSGHRSMKAIAKKVPTTKADFRYMKVYNHYKY